MNFHENQLTYNDPVEEQYEEIEEEHYEPQQQFEDCNNYIEVNPSRVEYQNDNYRNYYPEMSKTLEPEVKYVNTYEDRAPVYEHRYERPGQRSDEKQKLRIPTNYDTAPKYDRKNESQGYRKAYVGTGSGSEEDMQVESDKSDEHHSPHLYVTKKQESNFSKQNKLRTNAQNAQLDLQHSSSSSRLRFLKDEKPSRMDYSKDKTRSSTSNLGISNLERTKPVIRAELQMDDINKEPMNKTSYEFSYPSKISSSQSYNEKVESRYEPRQSPNEPSTALSDRYRKLVSTSTYGKALVSSYNSYFKHEREHIRPTTATLAKKYNYR